MMEFISNGGVLVLPEQLVMVLARIINIRLNAILNIASPLRFPLSIKLNIGEMF